MGKAIMVASTGVALASADFCNVIGYGADSATDANSRVSCTEDAVFSKLGAGISGGGSGTNNFQFRDTGANGNQLASRAGMGNCEDASNTDTLTAGDTFNIAYTDTGTNSTMAWLKQNVEFASGHGCFHIGGTFTGVVFDVASATRALAIEGGRVADGSTAEAQCGWRCRGYDTYAALQVRVTANARTNQSDFRNRIATANGSGLCSYAAGATGLVTHTGLSDAIASGAIVCASITLGTGVEDLTVTFVGATLKSTAGKQDRWIGQENGNARAASATANPMPIGGCTVVATTFTEAQARVKIGFDGCISNLRCYVGANTYTGNATLKLYKNGVAVLTTTITAAAQFQWFENTTDNVCFCDTDEFSLEWDEGTSGSATFYMAGFTISPLIADVNMPPLRRAA